MSRSGEQRERPGIARCIARACNSGAISADPLCRWSQGRYYRISGSGLSRCGISWAGELSVPVIPSAASPALGLTTMDYYLADSLLRAED